MGSQYVLANSDSSENITVKLEYCVANQIQNNDITCIFMEDLTIFS